MPASPRVRISLTVTIHGSMLVLIELRIPREPPGESSIVSTSFSKL
jgi:hypothetical protein